MTMTRLGAKNWDWLQRSQMTAAGAINANAALCYLGRQLAEDEREQMGAFMKWLEEYEVEIGPHNYEQRFKQFLQSCSHLEPSV